MRPFFKKSPQISASALEAALRGVADPLSGTDILTAGLVSSLGAEDGKVRLVLSVPREEAQRYAALPELCREALLRVPGVTAATPVLTAESAPSPNAPASARAQWNLTPVPGIGKIIAVASGKGGVGKSTVTVHLALALAACGARIGVLDADIYGPSIPRMLGQDSNSRAESTGKTLVPLETRGIKAMSMGFLLGDKAAVMRGPMVTKSLAQMLRGTDWAAGGAPLDLLLVDMPPGTGDIHLSMVQQVPLAHAGGGAILVTTPQAVALDDARKAAEMFRKVDVPILGVIENMSGFSDPSGQVHHLFGQGGGQTLATGLAVPLLGQVPLLPAIQQAGDTGVERAADPFIPIAKQLLESVV